jgi:DNA-binding CsgD family transcriptional regulator
VFTEIAAEPKGTTVVPSGARSARDSIDLDRQRILLELLRPHIELACANARHVTDQHSAHRSPALSKFGLTPRESHVADWLAVGKTNAEIAVILGASARTIEKHVERVLEKLGVENRTAAALIISDSSRRS